MKILLSWLHELAELGDDVDKLAETMNDLGLAVDGIERVGTPVEGVVVARVLALRPHPDADKIQLVDVDTGTGEPLQICCGAFNMRAGDLVPLATLGTTMPSGLAIARRKLRGQWSNGMLCSAAELGLSSDHAGIMILPADLGLGAPAFAALGITPEVVFDLDLTRNRPDAYSHLGVARDLSARFGTSFRPPAPDIAVAPYDEHVTVELADREGCGRFTACLITGVRVTSSPQWMADRLRRAGMRPINNVVDVSNYVMLELGRPNHPYDFAKLGGGGFRIRKAGAGEQMTTLDGIVRTLAADDVLICDATDSVIGIGGIMGGESTEIDDTTTTVALESAWFDPVHIARTAARLGLRTEASARFERGCDSDDMELATRRFVELLRLTCPDAQLHELIDLHGELPARPPVHLRTTRANAILGTELSSGDMADLLNPIGFVSTVVDEGLSVQIPTWRYDAATEIDVIEEVGRHYGLSRITKTVPKSARPGGLTREQRQRRLMRDVLVGLGVSEAMPNPFLAPGDLARAGLDESDALTITNPLDADESVLRTSLRPGLLKAVAYNASHRSTGISLFEVGHTYRRPSPPTQPTPLPDEREWLAVALAGRDATAAKAVLDELVAALYLADVAIEAVTADVTANAAPGMHPTRTARVVSFGDELGLVGEIDPAVLEAHGIAERVAWLELDTDTCLRRAGNERQYRRVSRFPASDIDLAFAVPESVGADVVGATISASVGELGERVALFDVYRGASVAPGTRSLAYSVRLRAPDRTLTDAEVAEVRRRAIEAVEAAHGATLR